MPDSRLVAKHFRQTYLTLFVGLGIVMAANYLGWTPLQWVGIGVMVVAALLAPGIGYRDRRRKPPNDDVGFRDTVRRLLRRTK